MKTSIRLPLLFLIVLFSGCAVTPQTADEYRRTASGSVIATVERFEVDRSYNRVANTLELMVDMCFGANTRQARPSGGNRQTTGTQWHPTVIVTDEKTEMHVQLAKEQGITNMGQLPEKGQYMLVVDAFPAGGNKTEIVMYRPVVGYGSLISTVKGWVTGEKQACPDE